MPRKKQQKVPKKLNHLSWTQLDQLLRRYNTTKQKITAERLGIAPSQLSKLYRQLGITHHRQPNGPFPETQGKLKFLRAHANKTLQWCGEKLSMTREGVRMMYKAYQIKRDRQPCITAVKAYLETRKNVEPLSEREVEQLASAVGKEEEYVRAVLRRLEQKYTTQRQQFRAQGVKVCCVCGQIKKLDQFYHSSTNYEGRCKHCSAIHTIKYQRLQSIKRAIEQGKDPATACRFRESIYGAAVVPTPEEIRKVAGKCKGPAYMRGTVISCGKPLRVKVE